MDFFLLSGFNIFFFVFSDFTYNIPKGNFLLAVFWTSWVFRLMCFINLGNFLSIIFKNVSFILISFFSPLFFSFVYSNYMYFKPQGSVPQIPDMFPFVYTFIFSVSVWMISFLSEFILTDSVFLNISYVLLSLSNTFLFLILFLFLVFLFDILL